MLTNQPFHKHSDHSRDAVLLLHGLGGGVYEMCLLGDQLHNEGYTVKAINYPGHDAPQYRMPASRWQDWYQHVEESYLELTQQYDTVSVVAFSTGCLLALRLAARHRVHKQALLAPFLRVKPYFGVQPESLVRKLAPLLSSPLAQVKRVTLPLKDQTMHIHVHAAAFFKTFNIGVVPSALELIGLVESELDQVDVPTLIVHSRLDSVVCPSSTEILVGKLTCDTQTCWLEQSDHIITLDVEKEQVWTAIREFFAS